MFSKRNPPRASVDLPEASSSRAPQRGSEIEGNRGVSRIATIGPESSVEGNVSGEEELLIEGRVKGRVECKNHPITIGSEGNVVGDVFAQTLYVAGCVEGRLIASHQVTIHRSARVTGTIISPRLALEEGGVFHGSIDMDPEHEVLVAAFGDAPPPGALVGTMVSDAPLQGEDEADAHADHEISRDGVS
ncbi:bactofilin family protein [Halomonas heilongjiangensis]|uniref:Polymer-forming cytoskeletal protein n=1 Tax=Halomonas heilongjiangensis TaxID=1387883 RepID=A0A2N7TT15_9GAMM|nr:polymer-forming cytoskeletal protein [Halomonas heilongjiangensis]PMR71316.1 hypothetical protein C1H66_02500 [Halomonas heilongjiangensis]PXX88587.1 hypothetical protein CR158_13565 [Halomonas heilongjiangensis]